MQSDPARYSKLPSDEAKVHAKIMEELKTMTPEEFSETLVDAGICTEDGELTEHYRDNGDEDEPMR